MKKGTPVHVKAAWVYNDLLRYWGLNNFEQIKSSEKIKWIYLKPNTMKDFKYKAFAFMLYAIFCVIFTTIKILVSFYNLIAS